MSIEKKIKMLLCIGTTAFYGMYGLEAAVLSEQKVTGEQGPQENYAEPIIKYLKKFQEKIDSEGIFSTMDFTGMKGDAPPWTGYPKKNIHGRPVDYKIAKIPTEADLMNGKGKFDKKGMEPRNIDVNELQDPLDPKRQAMPSGLPNEERSLFKKKYGLTMKKTIQDGKGELFLNGTDVLNTLRIQKTITGIGFAYTTTDYFETQAFRLGYSWKF
jgi:hypothetical protein